MKERGNLLKGDARFVDAPSSKERVRQYRLRQRELGRLKRELYLTDVEFTSLKDKLTKLRFKKESPNDKQPSKS